MGDSRKLRFYELDHESKMRLLKPHSHTSNRLAMEPGTRDLIPNFPEYKPPTLSYETHPNDLKFGYLQAFRGRILTLGTIIIPGSTWYEIRTWCVVSSR